MHILPYHTTSLSWKGPDTKRHSPFPLNSTIRCFLTLSPMFGLIKQSIPHSWLLPSHGYHGRTMWHRIPFSLIRVDTFHTPVFHFTSAHSLLHSFSWIYTPLILPLFSSNLVKLTEQISLSLFPFPYSLRNFKNNPKYGW